MKSTYLTLFLIYHHLQCVHAGLWGVRRPKAYYANRQNRDRIIGGDPAWIRDYPFTACLVKVTYKDDFRGGAAIVNRYWAITAAHCMTYISNHDIEQKIAFVRSNTSFWRDDYIAHTIVRKVVHNHYDPETTDFDIALVKVENAFDGKYEKPVALPSQYYTRYPGTQLTALGWGSTHPSNMLYSDGLRYVHLELSDHYSCISIFKNAESRKKITDRMVCAAAPEKDACIGDSGGPLTQNGFLIGIVSWGPTPCAHPVKPGVYTNVQFFTSWIESQVQDTPSYWWTDMDYPANIYPKAC